MTAEIERLRFQAAVLSAHKTKHFAEVVTMLRKNHPLKAEDKAALADLLERLNAPPAKKGRPPEPIFSPTQRLRRVVKEIRDLKERENLNLDVATETVLLGYEFSGKRFDREQISRELRRSKK